MDVTDTLAGEHGVFHLLVEQLADAMPRCTTLAELRIAAEPLALSLLGHARVEEETLFESYERATGSLGPLRCLRHEHEQMDRAIRSLFHLGDVVEMRARLEALLDLTRRHLAREEAVMFTAARQALSAGVLEECGAAWAAFRGVTIGDGSALPG
jgi:iron-sulfur cluster repair protein YtfE (RIC family)